MASTITSLRGQERGSKRGMTGVVLDLSGCRGQGERRVKGGEEHGHNQQQHQQQQLSLVALLLTAIRKSMVACSVDSKEDVISAVHRQMDIGFPTNVKHITHVTFDRFNGFLGLPVEFEVEIPSRVPSASASVFGVSPESMQCCYDSKENSVPTILLLMQEKLYSQGGLKAEGIFRINPDNGQEEYTREQLNKGIVPDDIDVHCLASLIKAWFRELPCGVLDGLSPEHVLRSNTEEECVELVKQLRPTQAALLDWAVELMADIVEEEELNKMNTRNIAMVFAPNMTQMADPLTALMHAVQVMNLLKTLIRKSLREREEAAMDEAWSFSSSPASKQYTEEGSSDSDRGLNGGCKLVEEMSEDDQIDGLLETAVEGGHGNSGEDEVERMEEIEDCFLRQLEWEEQAEVSERNGGGEGNATAREAPVVGCVEKTSRSGPTKSQSMKERSFRIVDEVDNRRSLSEREGMRKVLTKSFAKFESSIEQIFSLSHANYHQ